MNKRTMQLKIYELEGKHTNIKIEIDKLKDSKEIFQFMYANIGKNYINSHDLYHIETEIDRLINELLNIQFEIKEIKNEFDSLV